MGVSIVILAQGTRGTAGNSSLIRLPKVTCSRLFPADFPAGQDNIARQVTNEVPAPTPGKMRRVPADLPPIFGRISLLVHTQIRTQDYTWMCDIDRTQKWFSFSSQKIPTSI